MNITKKPKAEKQNPVNKQIPVDAEMSFYVRLVSSSLIFALTLILGFSTVVKIILLIAASVLSGYGIVIEAIDCVKERNLLSQPVIILFTVVASFLIGFCAEGTAIVLIYQIGVILTKFAINLSKKSGKDFYKQQSEDLINKIDSILANNSSCETNLRKEINFAAERILSVAMIIGILYAVVMPILTNMPYTISIHRALSIIVLCTPVSVVTAIPIVYMLGVQFAGHFGIVFRNSKNMEKCSGIDTLIIDKQGVLTSSHPKIVQVIPSRLDKQTFMNFFAHALYYSESNLAKAASDYYQDEYRTELISDFSVDDYSTVMVSIGGAKVEIGDIEYAASMGLDIRLDVVPEFTFYYMFINGKYTGKVAMDGTNFANSDELVTNIRSSGVGKCIILTEEDKNDCADFVSGVSADEFYTDLDTTSKLFFIKNYSEGAKANSAAYIYANGVESHTAAGVDIRVGEKGKFADVLVYEDFLENVPMLFKIARRTQQVASFNAIFAFSVKAILIFLVFLGASNTWFALFIDIVAQLATILMAIFITRETVIDKFKI